MIMCCAWCFAPMNLTEEDVFSVLNDGVIPVCSTQCQEAHQKMIQAELEDAEEGEQ